MTTSPDLSILIVNWNSREFLRKCLSSIFAETHGVSLEVIVVDNASFDGAAEMVATEFPQVRFIQSKTNLGFARANNLAFENSQGKVVLLLNPDTEVIDDAISKMFEAVRSLPDAGIVSCKLLNTDLSTQTACVKRFPTILGEILAIEWLRLKWPSLWSLDPLFSESHAPVRVDAVGGACQMIPREVYAAVGGLNSKYFMYAEDIEISAAALAKGKNTYYLGGARIIHHGGQSSTGKDRGSRWVSIMQKEAMWQFFRASRGKGYAVLYRITIAVVSALWLLAAVLLSPLVLIARGANGIVRVWHKWSGALQWALGLEKQTNKFRGQLAAESLTPRPNNSL
jgi:N-acetylglucosaminyl-diphospho-decaprenol L-rhamnosyltransferase